MTDPNSDPAYRINKLIVEYDILDYAIRRAIEELEMSNTRNKHCEKAKEILIKALADAVK